MSLYMVWNFKQTNAELRSCSVDDLTPATKFKLCASTL